MNILAVYHHQQLLLPSKVLTHREDIDPLLEQLGVRLEGLATLPKVSEDDTDQQIISVARSILVDSRLGATLEYLEVQKMDALPGYAEAPPSSEVERRFQQPTARLLVRGAGVMCLHQADQLLVLSCRRGDLISVPARLGHWFVASPGQPSVIVHGAATPQALIAENTGNDIAGRYQVLEL
ncbi:MAG: hypothetical protein R6V43_00470 [Halopseudomonas sp.]